MAHVSIFSGLGIEPEDVPALPTDEAVCARLGPFEPEESRSGGMQLFVETSEQQSDEVLIEFSAIHEKIVANLSRLQNGRPDCILSFGTTGTWQEKNGLDAKAINPIKRQLTETGLFNEVEYLPVDRERLIQLWMRTRTPVEASFPVKGLVPLPEIPGVAEAYLTLVPARAFVQEVLSDEDGRIRTSVFEQNVRAFLGDDNDVNKSIRMALQDPDLHARFAILNNGITIVAPDVKVISNKISVTDFQIVNGCQTSHVLHRNQGHISDSVWLPIKVIEANDPGIVGQVVEATNSQSQVEKSQFFSILPFVQKLQRYFDSFDTDEDRDRRVYFERRTMQYAGQGIGKSRIFDIHKLARAYAAMFLDLPHLAARYPTQVFEERRAELFQAQHREHAYYTAALALYRLELALSNQYVPRQYQSYKWHMLMLLKYLLAGSDAPGLAHRKFDDYCEKMVREIASGGKQSAPPYMEAVEIIKKVGEVSRDRLKGSRYTEELQTAARLAFKAKTSSSKSEQSRK